MGNRYAKTVIKEQNRKEDIMKTQNTIIALSRAAIDKIYWNCMSLKSQKLLLLPLAQISSWGHINGRSPNQSFEISIGKEYLQEAFGTNYKSRYINAKLREWVSDMLMEMNGYRKEDRKSLSEKEMDNLYTIYEIVKFTKTDMVLRIIDPAAVIELQNQKSGFLKFYTSSIFAFRQKESIPCSIAFRYGDVQIPGCNNPDERIFSASLIMLKKIMGRGVLDYVVLNVPEEERFFYEKYAYECTNWFYSNTKEEIERAKQFWLDENGMNCSGSIKFDSLETLERKFHELVQLSKFNRTLFEDRVIVPMLKELHESQMFDIHLQEVQHKPKTPGESSYISQDLFSKSYPKRKPRTEEEAKRYKLRQLDDYSDVLEYVFKYERLL